MAMTFVKEISRCFCSVCQNSLILRDKDVSRKILYSKWLEAGCDNYFQYLSNIRRKLLSSRRKLISRGGLGEEAEERLLSDGSHWVSPLSICATLDLSIIKTTPLKPESGLLFALKKNYRGGGHESRVSGK